MKRTIRLLGAIAVLAACGPESSPDAAPCDSAFQDESGACSLGSIAGVVTLEGSTSHEGVRIGVEGSDRFVTSDEAGLFELTGVAAGLHALELSAPGFVSQRMAVDVTPGRRETLGSVVLRRVQAVTSIVGSVRADDATDPAGAVVRVEDSSCVTLVDGDGTFRLLGVEPGPRNLVIRKDGFSPLVQPVTVVAGEANDAGDLTLVHLPRPGELRGRVIAAGTSAGIPGATVVVFGAGQFGTTDANGNFAIPDVAPGRYEVRAAHSGWAVATAADVEIRAGETTMVELALEPGEGVAVLLGRATRLDGGNPAGTIVTLRGGQSERTATTDGGGWWTIADVTPGLYEAVLAAPGLPRHLQRGIIVDGPLSRAPDLSLGEAVRIDDRSVDSAWIFERSRRALVQFRFDPASYLFDPDAPALEKLHDRSVEVLTVDEDGGFATVSLGGVLHRLDLGTGQLALVAPQPIKMIVARGASMLFLDADDTLVLLHAGRVLGEPLVGQAPEATDRASSVDLRQRWWRIDGWTTRWSVVVDLESGWSSPVGEELSLGPDPSKGLLFDQGHSVGPRYVQTVWGVDLAANAAWRLGAGRGFNDFAPDGVVAGLLLAPSQDEPAAFAMVDLHRRSVSNLVAGPAEAVTIGSRFLVIEADPGFHWVDLSTRSTGVLCASRSRASNTPGYRWFACRDDPANSPTEWKTIDLATGAIQTVATSSISIEWERLVWRDLSGTYHLRLSDTPGEVAFSCPSNPYLNPMPLDRHLIVMSCSGGSSLIETETATVAQLTTFGAPYDCEVGPSRTLALCRWPCQASNCLKLHDLADPQRAPVFVAETPFSTRSYAHLSRDGSRIALSERGELQILTQGTDGTFEAHPPCPFPVQPAGQFPPDSDWPEPVSLAGNADRVLLKFGGAFHVCGVDGTRVASLPGTLLDDRPVPLPRADQFLVGTRVVDLRAGTIEPVGDFVQDPWWAGGALFARVTDGLLRFTADGERSIVVPGSDLRNTERGGRHYVFGNGGDLWSIGPDGLLTQRLTGILDSTILGNGIVFETSLSEELGRLHRLDLETDQLVSLPDSVRRDRGIRIGADRILFHSPRPNVELGRWWPRTGSVEWLGAPGLFSGGIGGSDLVLVARERTIGIERAAGIRPVVEGETAAIVAERGGALVFTGTAPGGSYWLEARP